MAKWGNGRREKGEAGRGKEFVTKPDSLSSMPGYHKVEKEN